MFPSLILLGDAASSLGIRARSDTDALGHFKVKSDGPALVYLAEDALPQVRSRIDVLCRMRGKDIRALDLHVITAPVLRLDLKADQDRLAQTIETIRPRLVLLDPLVRLHRLDENSAAEISGLLGYIRDLQRRFDTALVLVHHASKKQRSQPGQALRGSSDLHAIGDSNAYLARDGDRIVLTLEHRAARAPEPMLLELVTDQAGEATHLRVRETNVPSDSTAEPGLDWQIMDALAQARKPMPRGELRAQLRINNQRLGEALQQLQESGRAKHTDGGWTLA